MGVGRRVGRMRQWPDLRVEGDPPGRPYMRQRAVTPTRSYALNISRRDRTRSISGLIPNSREMASDSSSKDIA